MFTFLLLVAFGLFFYLGYKFGENSLNNYAFSMSYKVNNIPKGAVSFSSNGNIKEAIEKKIQETIIEKDEIKKAYEDQIERIILSFSEKTT